MENKTKKPRMLKGIVASDKMQQTAVVSVTRLIKHPRVKKYYKITKRFKAQNRHNHYHTGDRVIIQETRPLSKEKHWIIISKA